MNNKPERFFGGIAAVVLGIVGVVYSLDAIFSEGLLSSMINNTYTTSILIHDLFIAVVLVISAISVLVGGILLALHSDATIISKTENT